MPAAASAGDEGREANDSNRIPPPRWCLDPHGPTVDNVPALNNTTKKLATDRVHS
jgi:hypothetical protein